jgi:hypothetical protein
MTDDIPKILLFKELLKSLSGNPLNFCKFVAPEYFNQKFGAIHYKMKREIMEFLRPETKENILVLEAPRGFAKTMFTTGLAMYLIAFIKKRYVVLASYSDVKAGEILSDIKKIASSFLFIETFGDWSLDGKWSAREVEFSSKYMDVKAKVLTRGIGSQFAGLRYGADRPQIVILDDLENPDESYNEDIVKTNMKKVMEVIRPGLAPNGKIIYIGTSFNYDCTLTRLKALPRGVKVVRIPALVDDSDLAEDMGVKMWHSVWEDRWPTAKLLDMKEEAIRNGNYDIFERQYMCNARPDGGMCQFAMDKLGTFELEELKDKQVHLFLVCDVAYSKKRLADKSGIVLVAIDREGNWYVIEALKGRWGDIRTIDILFETWVKYSEFGIQQVGIESYAFGLIKDKMYERMLKAGTFIPIVELKHMNRKKEDRIRVLLPTVEMGQMFLRGDCMDLREEMTNFDGKPKKTGDDLIDSLAYVKDLAFKPDKTEAEIEADKNMEVWNRFVHDTREANEGSFIDEELQRYEVGYGRDNDY